VESPTLGSVLLAGILLKLGVYSTLRVIRLLSVWTLTIVGLLTLVGTILVLGVTLIQVDMKAVVAFASVGHISTGLLVLTLVQTDSVKGALILCLAHGIVARALFILVGELSYILLTRKQQATSIFNSSLLLFLLLIVYSRFNFSFPGTYNFLSEVYSVSVLGSSLGSVAL
jgi:NADH:ubiquinone oxidoreductase subunit 4 (subunit M)